MWSLWSLNVYTRFMDSMKQLMMFILRSKYLFLLQSIYAIYMFIYSSRQYIVTANDVELKTFTDKYWNIAELEWFVRVRKVNVFNDTILMTVFIWRWLKKLFTLRSLLRICESTKEEERRAAMRAGVREYIYMHACDESSAPINYPLNVLSNATSLETFVLIYSYPLRYVYPAGACTSRSLYNF